MASPIPRILSFKEAMAELNEEVRKYFKNKKVGKKTIVYANRHDLKYTYDKYDGRCVYCQLPLRVRGLNDQGPHFQFYAPLDRGGKVHRDNIVLVCKMHKRRYNPSRVQRERIPNVNTFSDIVEALVLSLREREDALNNKQGARVIYYTELVRRLKVDINSIFNDLGIHIAYKAFLEDQPRNIEIAIEDESTISEALVNLIEGKDSNDVLSERIKQLLTLKHSRPVRKI